MRTAEEWWNESVETVDMIRRIQADALRHAAAVCLDLEYDTDKDPATQCADMLKAEAAKLEGK
jgi:hypothetical protein